jgi:hypothetical protein
MEEILTAKACLNCGDRVGPGRKDKKYCSEACKTEYHNKLTEQKREARKQEEEISLPDFIKKIQDILLHNREIMDAMLRDGEGRKRFEKRDLLGRGFNVKYFTSQAPTTEGEIYCFCFEMGYKDVEDERVIIIRREREVIC